MPIYKWAENNGEIVEANYDESVDKLTPEQAKDELINALSLFGNQVTFTVRDDINYIYDIASTDSQGNTDEYIVCIREMTPGGRKGLKDEQRIQPEAQQINTIYDANNCGKTAVLMGVYRRTGITIMCAWKANYSNATSPTTGISKQIKITSIANAMKEGFVQQPKGRGEYACAFRKEFIYFYLKNSSWLHGDTVEDLANYISESNEPYLVQNIRFKTGYQTDFERNRIVFGAPGTGKSYKLKEDSNTLLKGNKDTYERVTFHPDYYYSHFVGTYKPVTDDSNSEIKYEFVPGPFMRVYVEALRSGRTENPQPHLLLIEEINRAKVAAVFGEVFQLLDRDDDGVSEYKIHASEDIRKYLAKELGGDPDIYKTIKIPDNMFIWATMNSADQGVFPMDTAFKRRWSFEYLGIDENDGDIKGKIILGKGIHELEIKWNQLRKAINEKLAEDYKVNEDKLMGPYFLSKRIMQTVNATDDTIADPDKLKSAFKNKVIMYLYEDAAKQNKHKLFDGCNSSGYSTARYSSICDAFDEIGIDIFGDGFRELYDNQGV